MHTEESLERVVETYSDMVYRLAYAQTRSRQDADDVYQEVFLRYLRRRPIFDSPEHQKAWLIRVTLNCCKKLWASPWRRRTVPLEEMREASPQGWEQPFYPELARALEQLPAHYRAVIHLFYYEDMSVEQISRTLDRKPSTVRTQLTRARQRLRELLKEDHYDFERCLPQKFDFRISKPGPARQGHVPRRGNPG